MKKNTKKTKITVGILIGLILILGIFWAVLAYFNSAKTRSAKEMQFIDVTRNMELELYSIIRDTQSQSSTAGTDSIQPSDGSALAADTSGSSQILPLLQYIRNGRSAYMTDEWILLCGNLDESLARQLDEKDINQTFSSLKGSESVLDPLSDNSLDYVHLCASLNVAKGSFSQIEDGKQLVQEAGWIGDLLQAVGSGEDSSLIGTDDGSLNTADILADIDAANLLQMMQEHPDSKFYALLKSYYGEKTDRYQNFRNAYYSQISDADGLAQAMKNAVMNEQSSVLEPLCQSLNVNRADKAGQIEQMCQALAKIIIEG